MVSKRTLHMLVVDCDEPVCTATTELLESMGYRAYGKTQSLGALKAFSEDPDKFDVAIIEPAMPEIAGLELATRFRRIRPGFPVLFYGGYADVSLSDQMTANGFGRITPSIPANYFSRCFMRFWGDVRKSFSQREKKVLVKLVKT